ncbi:MAG: thiamine phosphate synthase [Endomicrobiales bacterium]
MNNRNDLFHGLYAITAEKYSLGRSTVEVARLMLEAGVRILQYREKDKTAAEKYVQCLELREMTRRLGALFIVNDDVHIALAVKADGVHVGQEDLPLAAVRALVGTGMMVGVSTHCPEQALAAAASGADYIGVGPLYPTKTKENVCVAVGLEYLDFVVRNIALPFVAIGGIKRYNLGEVLRRGARCAALVTEIVSAPDIPERVREVTAAFHAK